MNLERIEITNWGPFIGSHEIDLTITEDSPVILIFGENGKGKTSLAKAIRWCLYGADSNIDERNYANWEKTLQGSEFTVEVRISFTVTTVDAISSIKKVLSYEISRRFTAKPDASAALELSTINASCSLIDDDGKLIDAMSIPRFVNRYLPLEMARFFLFDGEELNSLKSELETEGATTVVRASIESVMGMPAIRNLQRIMNVEQQAIDAKVKASKRHAGAQLSLESATKALDVHELATNDMKRELIKQEKLSEYLRSELAHIDDARTALILIDRMEDGLKKAKLKIIEAEHEISDSFQTLWWIPLADQIVLSQNREKKSRILEDDRKQKVMRLRSLETILETGKCPECDQTMNVSQAVRDEIDEIRNYLNSASSQQDQKNGFTERFLNPGEARLGLSSLFTDKRRAVAEARVLEDDLRVERFKLAGVDIEKTRGLPQKLEKNAQYIGSLRTNLIHRDKECNDLKIKVSESRKNLRKLGGIPISDENRSAALQQLQDIVLKVETTFRDLVRQEVQEVASRHYVYMMKDADLIGVQITGDFRVRAISASLEIPKPFSSYGQSLIAVYAFIGALIDVSGHESAWLIDTVGSRLDKDNMKSVWEWLASRKRQVIAMPHSGELTHEDANKFLAGKISRRYEIIQSTASKSGSQFNQVGA